MRPLSYRLREALVPILFLIATAFPMHGQMSQALFKQSDIVFAGTVTQIGAVTLSNVTKSPTTIVVRVESVLKKPPAVSLKKNDDVTVDVKDPSAFQPGTHATFYTQSWIFGSSVAVREVGHEIKPSGEAAATATAGQATVNQVQAQIQDQDLQERLNSSDVVVAGRVMEVHPWSAPKLAATRSRVTEHDANWQEAVIQVTSAIKGANPNQKVVVRFPGSYDVAWVNAPKFRKDQEGTFFLRKDQTTGTAKAMLAGSQVTAFTALNAKDVLPAAEADRVRSLLRK